MIARGSSRLLLVVLAAAGPGAAAEPEALSRAGDLGLELLDAPVGDAAYIEEVEPGGPAAFAGLVAGDRIVGIDGRQFSTVAALERAVARKRPGEVVRLVVRHPVEPGHPQLVTGELALSVRARPREKAEGLVTDYDAFLSSDTRLRAVITKPVGDGPWPALLIAPDFVRLPSDDPGPNPDREIAHGLARRGFLVMRYDQRGLGDSEGEAWGDVGFDSEVADARAALDALLARNDVDRSKVVLFGRGVGASLAALAGDTRGDVAGVAGWGAGVRPVVEWHIAITRLQHDALDVSPVDAGPLVDVLARSLALLISGVEPDRCRELIPESHSSWDPQDRFFAKVPGYWRERNAADVLGAWARVRGPLLLLRGEHDVNAPREEYDVLRKVLEEARHPDFRFEELPGLDLDLGVVASDRDAVRRYARGDRTPDGAAALVDRLVAWIAGLPPVKPPLQSRP